MSYIFLVGHLQNIFMKHDLYLNPNDFWQKRKISNFDPYNLLLAIATNTPVRLVTGFVVQGHIWTGNKTKILSKKSFFCSGPVYQSRVDSRQRGCKSSSINTPLRMKRFTL